MYLKRLLRAWNSSQPLAISCPICPIWLSKSNLLGHIYFTFPMEWPANFKLVFKLCYCVVCIKWLVVWFRFVKYFKTSVLKGYPIYLQYLSVNNHYLMKWYTYTPELEITVLPIDHFQSNFRKGKILISVLIGKPIKSTIMFIL